MSTFCSTCGSSLAADVRFCPQCGTPTSTYYSNSGASPHEPTALAAPLQIPATDYGPNPYGVPLENPYEPLNPYKVPPPPPPSRHFSVLLAALLIGLALLLIGAGGLIYYLTSSRPYLQHAQPTTTVATTTAAATVVVENPYTHSGTLALSDPLTDNSKGYKWDEGTVSDGSFCKFISGAYYANQTNPQYLHQCVAEATDFSNFAFEVQMTIIKGGAGGLVFRADNTADKWYSVSIDQNGQYSLYRYDGFGRAGITLASGASSAIKLGVNQPNLIAVVAAGSTFDLYVNSQKLASINDHTYSHGEIGVIVYNAGEIAFSNARVWTF